MNISGQVVEQSTFTINEYNLAKRAAETLNKHYPGHLWGVNVNSSVMTVQDLYLSGEWGFVLHIPAMYSASDWDQRVMRAGGELLERYRQRRGKVDEAGIHQLQVDFSGRHKAES